MLTFISRSNPIVQAQRNVTQAYAKPDAATWALRNTSLSARVGLRDDPYAAYGGLQIGW